MDFDNIMLLKKNIIKIIKHDKKTKNIVECWEGDRLKIFNIDKISHKYSNTKVPLYRFFYNFDKENIIEKIETINNSEENIITRNNHYNVIYKCIKTGPTYGAFFEKTLTIKRPISWTPTVIYVQMVQLKWANLLVQHANALRPIMLC